MPRKALATIAIVSIMFSLVGCGATPTPEPTTSEPTAASPEGEVLKLAVQPCWEPSVTYDVFAPLADYLSEETGLNIELIVPETEEDFHEMIRDVDFTLQDSFSVYIHNLVGPAFNPLAIVVSEEGEPEEMGSILAKADSSIESLSDLSGKTFLFGPEHNAPKFLAAYVTLKASGIDPDEDLASYDFGGDCSENAMAVFLGDYDAGAVCKDFVEGEEGRERFDFETDLRVIADTIPVPHWVFSASGELDSETATKVTEALLKLAPESPLAEEVLEETEFGGFQELVGNELDEIEELITTYSIPIE